MKVKVTKWIEEVVEMPNEMFELDTEKPMKFVSKYRLKEEYGDYLEKHHISCIEDMNGDTIAEC